MSGDEKTYATLQSSVEYPPHNFLGYKKRKEKEKHLHFYFISLFSFDKMFVNI